MPIKKSKRHSKYIGQFGEAIVCNMLSRSGFEVMLVDHVGIDVVAYRSDVGRIGISVKSRTRSVKKSEQTSINLFRSDDDGLETMCKFFDLEPWIAVYVEIESGADLYLTSLENFRERYAGREGLTILAWKMKAKHRQEYSLDPNVMHLSIQFSQNNWFAQFD